METCVEAKETKSSLKQKGSSFPPLSQSNKPPGISSSLSGQHSRRRAQSNQFISSRQSGRFSLSSRRSNSIGSARSGSSALEERGDIDTETLAIALELRDLKARREKDAQETFERIMEVSDKLGGLKSNLRARTSHSRNISVSPKALEAPPPSGTYFGPGAHFLDWYIPKHIAGSRALRRTSSAGGQKSGLVCSPLHRPEKHEWTEKTIDPKASGLPIPTPAPPRIIDYPCTWENKLKDELRKYRFKMDRPASPQYQSPSAQPKMTNPQLKTLSSRKAKKTKAFALDSSDLKLNGSMFTKTHVATVPWFIVHPEWRNEPRINVTLPRLEPAPDSERECV